MAQLTIALAGNPNTGKSTVFNALTGSRQHVGNWPGKTVAKKTGVWRHDGREYEIVDLPGTYSLSAYSLEEVIARQYLVDARPDVVVVVVDAGNLERNLYLVAQILEMRRQVVVVLNMADAAASRGVRIDTDALSAALGASVVSTTASRGRGLDELATELQRVADAATELQRVADAATDDRAGGSYEDHERDVTAGGAALVIDYGIDLEREIDGVAPLVRAHGELASLGDARWLAMKLLEGDPDLTVKVVGMPGTEAITVRARVGAARLQEALDYDVDTLVADGRYRWINDVVRRVVQRPAVDEDTLTDRIDAVVTHRWLGIPIFLALMWVVFKTTTDVSAPYVDWIATVIDGPVTGWIARVIEFVGLSGTWIESLLVDGIVAGVGGVLVFVPVLMALYVALALLEDSGYMARAAFVMDRLMRSFGLHGKSFLPMLVGFGCTVPAIYATRTLRDERDRLLTGLLVPFMSCGARLPVYVLFATVFFPQHGGSVVFAMYLVGIVTALLLAVVLKRSLFRSSHPAPFVMELPPYRMPTPRGVFTHMWSRTKSFVRRAWTIILAVSVVLWVLMAIPGGRSDGNAGADSAAGGSGAWALSSSVDNSLFARAAGFAAPVFSPLGFDSWQAAGAIITGLVAKEVVVSTMAQVYGTELPAADSSAARPRFVDDLRVIGSGFGHATAETLRAVPSIVGIQLGDRTSTAPPSALMDAIHDDFSRSSGGYPALAGLAFMVFVLLYTPCIVAIAAARHEFGVRWMWTSALGQLAIAWLMAFAVFQGGKILLG